MTDPINDQTLNLLHEFFTVLIIGSSFSNFIDFFLSSLFVEMKFETSGLKIKLAPSFKHWLK